MNYFINWSMDKRIVGKFLQSERILNYLGGNPKLLNAIYFEKLDTEAITPIAILGKKAKITDLISNVGAGGHLHLLMSGKLGKIIKNHRTEGVQFFQSTFPHQTIKKSMISSISICLLIAMK